MGLDNFLAQNGIPIAKYFISGTWENVLAEGNAPAGAMIQAFQAYKETGIDRFLLYCTETSQRDHEKPKDFNKQSKTQYESQGSH